MPGCRPSKRPSSPPSGSEERGPGGRPGDRGEREREAVKGRNALLHQPVTKERRCGPPANPLTRRELDVLRLLAKGNTNRQIADLLGLSPRTVENHRANLMGKLGLASRVELVNYAEEHDLLH